MSYYVYLLASRRHGTPYLGVTSEIERPVYEHKNKLGGGFTAKYGVDLLVWFEVYDDQTAAPARNKSRNGAATGRSD